MVGFTSGEGHFFISITSNNKSRIKSSVSLRFKITQHSRDKQLIESFITYFNCGKVYNENNTTIFRVTKYSDIIEKIIPFFYRYPIIGVKYNDFVD
jgi:hypothetical protein